MPISAHTHTYMLSAYISIHVHTHTGTRGLKGNMFVIKSGVAVCSGGILKPSWNDEKQKECWALSSFNGLRFEYIHVSHNKAACHSFGVYVHTAWLLGGLWLLWEVMRNPWRTACLLWKPSGTKVASCAQLMYTSVVDRNIGDASMLIRNVAHPTDFYSSITYLVVSLQGCESDMRILLWGPRVFYFGLAASTT